MADLKKIPTNIKGFDDLLYNGLHLKDKDGTIIAICGEDSVHKLQFSMHLMCGVTKSLREDKKSTANPWFFSFTKDETALIDICDNFQISNAIYAYLEDCRQNKETDSKKLY